MKLEPIPQAFISISRHFQHRHKWRWVPGDNHTDQPQTISSTHLGWYCCGNSPSITSEEYAVEEINQAICQQFFGTNPQKYHKLLLDSPSLDTSNSDPDINFSKVFTFQRLCWTKSPNKTYCTVCVYGTSSYKVLIKHLLIDSEVLQQNPSSRVTFVDHNMQHGDCHTQAQFGKAIF